jgi:hypothetical protein
MNERINELLIRRADRELYSREKDELIDLLLELLRKEPDHAVTDAGIASRT